MIILIYANCQGYLLSKFFESYNKLYNNNIDIYYFSNYTNIEINETNKFNDILKNCDVFIYQHNKGNTNIKYDINQLKDTCIKIKIVWWIFNGFWIDSTYNPYKQIIYNNIKYTFLETEWNDIILQLYGIHNSFINFYGSYNDVKNKINNMIIDKNKIYDFFNYQCDKFKNIDINSDIPMYDYFINNYKNQELFHCPIHPTNYFLFEVFKRILYKLNLINSKISNINEKNFLNNLKNYELISYSRPILPIVKNTLNIQFNIDYINIFKCYLEDITLKLNIYEYYFIRLSPSHFKIFMDLKNNKIIPKTVNYLIYRINYKDLKNLKNEDLIKHYNQYSKIENRDDNFIDLNFNWKIYLFLNKDLNFKTMEECYEHYFKYGKKENRLPSYNDINFIWNTNYDEYDEYIKYTQNI